MTGGHEFEIRSYNDVGPIRFGMTPLEVRQALDSEFKSFKRAPGDAHPCDYFTTLQCFVYYDGNAEVEAVEFAEPAKPIFDSVSLLRVAFSKLLDLVRRIDPDVKISADGFTSDAIGLGAWAPDAEEDPTKPAESIIAFKRGYYD